MGSGFHPFWLPRRGSSSEEYEDAFAADVAAGRYALADGATESGFAGLWARLLVEDFVHPAASDVDRWADGLPALQEQWRADVSQRALPWYGEAQFAQGAFATFLGLVLTASPDGQRLWRAVAVGDACLFHTRGPALLAAFPVDQSEKFSSSPQLLGSRMSPPAIRERLALRRHGSGLPQDRLWMASDALAQWCLREHEQGNAPWIEMQSLLTVPEAEQCFAFWIERLRNTGRLRNDDVTLVAVEL